MGDAGTMADGEWRRTVHCKDALGRDRALTVVLDDGKLMLGIPAGEAAILDLGAGAEQLKTYIDEARLAAATQLMGRSPVAPPLTCELREATSFYVLDREDRQLPLGVGLNGTRVAFNGPPRFWQVEYTMAGSIGRKVLALEQIARDLFRG